MRLAKSEAARTEWSGGGQVIGASGVAGKNVAPRPQKKAIICTAKQVEYVTEDQQAGTEKIEITPEMIEAGRMQ